MRFFKLRDFSQDCLYVRNSNGDAVRSVYYSSELIKVREVQGLWSVNFWR